MVEAVIVPDRSLVLELVTNCPLNRGCVSQCFALEGASLNLISRARCSHVAQGYFSDYGYTFEQDPVNTEDSSTEKVCVVRGVC